MLQRVCRNTLPRYHSLSPVAGCKKSTRPPGSALSIGSNSFVGLSAVHGTLLQSLTHFATQQKSFAQYAKHFFLPSHANPQKHFYLQPEKEVRFSGLVKRAFFPTYPPESQNPKPGIPLFCFFCFGQPVHHILSFILFWLVMDRPARSSFTFSFKIPCLSFVLQLESGTIVLLLETSFLTMQ
jgi:hypothetical protein